MEAIKILENHLSLQRDMILLIKEYNTLAKKHTELLNKQLMLEKELTKYKLMVNRTPSMN